MCLRAGGVKVSSVKLRDGHVNAVGLKDKADSYR